MEEIKVGNFIRTPYHTIEKVVEIEKSKNKMYDDMVTTDKSCYGLNWLKRNGTKSSSDLISLVEEGDYVNGIEVMGIYVPRDNWEPIQINVDSQTVKYFLVDQIKSIVTKEMFKSVEYRVE